jgi:hypothetical protein
LARLTIQCDAPNYGCVLDPGGPTTSYNAAEFNQGNYVTMTGFAYGNHPNSWFAVVDYSGVGYTGGQYVTIDHNYFHDVGLTASGGCPAEGMIDTVHGAVGFVATRNKIINYGDYTLASCGYAHGIYTGNGAVIQNNVIGRVPGYGIQIYTANCGNVVENNTIFDASEGGMIFGGDGVGCTGAYGYNVITNNILENNGTLGTANCPSDCGGIVELDYGPGNLYGNNQFYGNLSGVGGSTANCVNCHPSCVNSITTEAPSATFLNFQDDGSGNYHLKDTSLAVNSADGTNAPSVDFDGNPRPSRGGYDIGAYQLGLYAPINLRAVPH